MQYNYLPNVFIVTKNKHEYYNTATCLHYTKISHWKIRHTVNYCTICLSYNHLNKTIHFYSKGIRVAELIGKSFIQILSRKQLKFVYYNVIKFIYYPFLWTYIHTKNFTASQ